MVVEDRFKTRVARPLPQRGLPALPCEPNPAQRKNSVCGHHPLLLM